MDYALGIDIGATNVKAIGVTSAGQTLWKETFSTRDDESQAWLAEIQGYVHRIDRQRGTAREIGIACPGLVARDGRSIAWMAGRMSGVQGLDWTEHLGRSRPVRVINDAHGALLGETWIGAAREVKNAILLTLGTGVGGAILSDGRLLRGAIGRAGHLGHISLNPDGAPDIVGTPGSLEDAIGDSTIGVRSESRFESTTDLVQAVRAGDDHAKAVWLKSIKALAAGIVSMVNCVDPEVVILAGGVTGAGRYLLEPLEEYLAQFEWRPHGLRVKMVVASLGEYAGAVGAARDAMQN
jgi:glucokinase